MNSLKAWIGRNIMPWQSEDCIVLCNRDGSFVLAYEKAKKVKIESKLEWLVKLRNIGVKAAHPNDGWHNNEKHEITLCYPYFNDNADVGDLIAIGDNRNFLVVTAISCEPGIFRRTFYYNGEHFKQPMENK